MIVTAWMSKIKPLHDPTSKSGMARLMVRQKAVECGFGSVLKARNLRQLLWRIRVCIHASEEIEAKIFIA
ncbi:hypothetical protein Ancab_021942 [Ancistrocladus abbreviatus]